jgi:hypothetical protein
MSWEIHRLGLREAQNAQLQNLCLHSCLTDGQRKTDSGSRDIRIDRSSHPVFLA